MKTNLGKNLWAALLTAALAPAARGGFGDGLSSAGAEAAGNAVVARGGEAAGLFVNPAGLALLDRGELSLMYAKPLTGLPDVSVQHGAAAVAVPVGERGSFGGGMRAFDNAGLSRELEGTVGGALRLGGRWRAGAAASFLQRSYDVGSIPGASSDPVFAGGSSKSGIGLDAGLMFQASPALRLGAAVRNVNRPDLGLAVEDKVPMTWRTGGAYAWNRFTFLGEARGRSEASDVDSKWGLGVEWNATGPLMFRAGADAGQVAAGMGLGFRDLRLDYAFSFERSQGAGEAGNHRMSLGYRFGATRGESVERAPARKAPRASAQRRPAAKKASGTEGISTRDTRAYPPAPRTKKPATRRLRPVR